jgi:gliding motility-associated-like protein
MKTLRSISLTLLMVFMAGNVTGQDVTQPLSPMLDNVTVDPLTGYATLRWLPSSSPDVGSYIVYTVSNSIAYAVDTLFSPWVTEYVHIGSAARYMSVTYVVAAMDTSLNISPLSNSLSTIYMTAVNDTCNAVVELNWTQYINPAYPHSGYELWIKRGGFPAELHETLGPLQTSYNYFDIDPSATYCFYVAATGISGICSSSNMQCISSGSEVLPAWISADAVRVEDKGLTVTGSYDSGTDIRKFITQLPDKTTGEWITAGEATGSDGTVTVPVNDADTNTVNLYRLAAVNNCGKTLVHSMPVRNLVLNASLTGTVIELKWNNPFPAAQARFTIWRNTGDSYRELAGNLSDTIMTEDYSSFGEEAYAEAIAYFITAVPYETPSGSLLFRSNISLVPSITNIIMPNAFTPDGDGNNDIFIPRLSFIPADYEFRVYSRAGVLLFRSADHGEGWDGRHNGRLMPPGVYLWSLRLMVPSGLREQRKGTVTILP